MQQFGIAIALTLATFSVVTFPAQACDRSIPCRANKQDAVTQTLIETAIALSEKIRDPEEKAKVQISLAGYAINVQQREMLLKQAYTAIQAIDNPIKRAEALADIAGTYQASKLPKREIEKILVEAFAIVTPLPASEEKDKALNQIAFRYALNGQYDQALKVIDQIKDPFGRSTTTSFSLSVAIRAEVEANNPEGAFKLIETVESSIADTLSDQPETAKISPELLAQFRQQDRRRQQAHLLIELAQGYREAGKAQLFQQTLDRVYRFLPEFSDDELFVAQLLIDLEQTEKATELLNRAEQRLLSNARTIDILTDSRADDSLSLSHLAEGFMQVNQLNHALQLLEKALQASDDPSWQAATLNGFASQLYEKGRTQRASELLTRSRNLVQQISDPQEKAAALVHLAITYESVDQKNEAIAIARQIQQFPIAVWQEQAGDLFRLFENVGDYERVERIAAIANQNEAWISLVQHYMKVKDFDRAIQIARSIPSISQRAAALTSIAADYTKSGQIEKGSAMLLQAFELTQSTQLETSTLTSMFRTYLEFAEHSQSAEQVLALMKLIKDPAERETAIAEILRYTETDSLNLASWVEVITGFSDAEKRDEGLSTIAYEYANRNQYTEAIKTIQRMQHPASKTETLLGLMNRYASSDFTLSSAEQETLRTIVQQLAF
ncbi:tetratricopeptide repeat protein [Leptolyngbya sp. NIES-2104]|uniref:tetratricopeptide repeat protein n=1 Tax=Leptolyngbya sp. NIES-2104 TaxID=1552121 RepID=UPI0006EC6C90|nr:hypothetical protein [Leptolyngbya sp. NIES-2104]GAP94869.1 TPR repeat [Leptolyngbya sp. NIES-2104]